MVSYYTLGEQEVVLDPYGNRYTLRIRDLPPEDKPREKLIKHGPEALSPPELLAVIMNTGTKREGVLAMSARLLKGYGEKAIVNERNPKRIAEELNVPISKACQIVAAFELGRRFYKNQSGRPVVIRTGKQVFDYLKDMRELPKEQLRGLYLNNHYRIVHDEIISIGSFTTNIVHPREVFKPALEYSASAVILAHNHPSGVLKPSKDDIEITNQLIEAGKILGVDLLDHVVIAKNKFISIPAHYA